VQKDLDDHPEKARAGNYLVKQYASNQGSYKTKRLGQTKKVRLVFLQAGLLAQTNCVRLRANERPRGERLVLLQVGLFGQAKLVRLITNERPTGERLVFHQVGLLDQTARLLEREVCGETDAANTNLINTITNGVAEAFFFVGV
jgi:hypothetical protein